MALNSSHFWSSPDHFLPFLFNLTTEGNFSSALVDFKLNQSFVQQIVQNAAKERLQNPTETDWVKGVKYWLDGPLGFSLACIGLILNAIALCMLAKQRVQRTFHSLMMFLSCWDFGYLLFSQFLFALPVLNDSFRESMYIWLVPYFIPMAQICLSGSCFTTVALTVERYIAICAPFFRMKYNIKAYAYMLPILIFVPIYNIPRFFEFESFENITYICTDGQNNSTNGESADSSQMVIDEEAYENRLELGFQCQDWHKKTLLQLDVTDTRKNELYISIYVNFVNYAVNLAFPIITLVILNTLICKELRKNRTPEVRRNQNQQAENALRKRDIRMTRISIVIVVVFVVCHVPRFVPNVSELILGKLTKPFQALISFNNVLQIISSTVNYAIYFGSCWKFRKAERSNNQTQRMLQQLEMRPLMNRQQTEEQGFIEVLSSPDISPTNNGNGTTTSSNMPFTRLCRQTYV